MHKIKQVIPPAILGCNFIIYLFAKMAYNQRSVHNNSLLNFLANELKNL